MTDDLTEQDRAPTEATKREGQASRSGGGKPPEERLERGATVGRYVVLDVLGEGGMGVVYGAYDPELDRKVAIKLLQADAAGDSTGGDQAWLQREAQAMARLAHPNVIAVHDVGTLPGDRVFVAMELVEGSTLRRWLKAEPRKWRDVLRVMLGAGAGLAAAHAAGLVHRDFKPDNVLVGDDGRVRVMDFGLARLRTDEDATPASRSSDLNIEAHSPLSESLTQVGAVVGTPAYMAPEIYDGHGADARTDQFAFGVALYEALYRTRPFEKKALAPPRDAVPKPKEPPEVGVPVKIQRVVMRAISIDPAERYASMDALLAELAIDPFRSRRHLAIAAGVVLAIGATVGGAFAIAHSRGQLCKGADRRLAGVWDGPTTRAIHAQFEATKVPFAAHAYAAVAKAIDGYTAEWVTTSVESCEATRLHGEQSEEVLSLRQDCLDQRLEELRAFTELLRNADEPLLDKVEAAVEKLEPIKQCSNIAALRAPGLPSPEIKAKLGPVNTELAAAKAAMIAGKLGASINHATKAADTAKQIGFEPAEAEARMVLGLTLTLVGNPSDGAATLGEATWVGLRSRRDDVAAMAALLDAMTTAENLGKLDEAKIWLGIGTAAAARGGGDRMLELHRLEVAGMIAGQSGDLGTAATDHEQALELAVKLFGPDAVVVAHNELLIAATLTRSGSYGKGAAHYERALALLEQSFGKVHPDLAPVLTGLGACYDHAGKIDKARETYERAIAIREHAFGKTSPVLIPTLNNFADFLRKHGDATKALAYLDRARPMAKVLGTSHPLNHQLETTYAETLFAAGRVDEARTLFDDVIALEDKVHSPILPETLTSRAEIPLAAASWQEAAALCERAIALHEVAGGPDQPSLWKPLTCLGLAKLGLGKPDEARPALERALALATKLQVPDDDLRPTRDALARLK